MPRQLLISTLDDGWHDRDSILLHACFQCLADCVEQEKVLDNHIDWNHDKKTQQAHQELTTLYEWWKTRVASLAEASGIISAAADDYKTDDEMLIRLIQVRSYLWT